MREEDQSNIEWGMADIQDQYSKSRVLCISGGVDSVIAWYYLNKPTAVYFNTGVPYAAKEKRALMNLGIPFIEDNSLKFPETSIYIPHRNLLFASRASQYGDNVYIAGLKDDMVEDKNEMAFAVMSACLTAIGKKPVQVLSPFWDMMKEDIIRWFMANYSYAEYILKCTCSCYSNIGKECMACEACFRKNCALFANGIKRPFEFNKLIQYYTNRALEGVYVSKRNESILNYVEWLNGQRKTVQHTERQEGLLL